MHNDEIKLCRTLGAHTPYSESELSDRGIDAADAPRASGKPLGNAALAGTFLLPGLTNPKQNLNSQMSR